MSVERAFEAILESDVRFGYLDRSEQAQRQVHPRVVLNTETSSMLRVLREELRHASAFAFSVAFVTPGAIALLKQEFVEFEGEGLIVTSDYLGFNSPRAFAELYGLRKFGIDVRLHTESAYHPKGYIFGYDDRVTAILGSSNLTKGALVQNHEWNLKVSAARRSDLADQFAQLVSEQRGESVPLTLDWIAQYEQRYVAPADEVRGPRPPLQKIDVHQVQGEIVVDVPAHHDYQWSDHVVEVQADSPPFRHAAIPPRIAPDRTSAPAADSELRSEVVPNAMQREALREIQAMRDTGARKAIVISATGTGKTILSAMDVREVRPDRFLFVVHREQILDRAIFEYQRVLGAPASDFGKLTGSAKEGDRKYVFATVQTLSQAEVLEAYGPEDFDYILIDEVHRAGAASYERLVAHFNPKFLMGMTATPERPDGFNVFELFDYNVPYEIRLGRALENDMLSPFHYYGVSDVRFEDGTTTAVEDGLDRLASRVRVDHILDALDTYGQAGIQPRGLIFCSRKDEAHALSAALNEREFRGRPLRTVALTGDDAQADRERAVVRLEAGELDYVLTVDIFNEGVDIPSINQVVMLRQTQSSIVFVQQLGRGLRKARAKEYLVVIDFIGNYANNYLIPVALFGDESLSKESLRQNLIAAEESGVLPGLSSVRFDRISQKRVLDAISTAKLDSLSNLRYSIEMLENRLGRVPTLNDFQRFESVDPVLLATRWGNYPALLAKLLGVEHGLTEPQLEALTLISHEALDAKRPDELLLLRELLVRGGVTPDVTTNTVQVANETWPADRFASATRSLTMDFLTETEQKKYGRAILERDGEAVVATPAFLDGYRTSPEFEAAVDDLITTGLAMVTSRYDDSQAFTPGRRYSRKDACRLLGWPKNVMSTIYGYKVDQQTGTCPIFITHHKADHISASTAYDDELIDRRTMRWYTRSRRTLASGEVAAIVEHRVQPYVFAKKDDAEGSDFYFLGRARATDAEQTTMRGDDGEQLSVVRMALKFDQPIDIGVFDYFHPVVTD